MPRQHNQADDRRSLNPRDQFGRLWALCIEVRTGEPTGAVLPAGWSDPLRTPMHLVTMLKTEFGQVDLGRVQVNFDQWIGEIEHAEQKWYERLHEIALSKYSSLDPERVPHLDQDQLLLRLTGPKPFPSSEALKRAKGGEKGLLGMEPMTQEQRALLKMQTLEDLKAPLPKKAEEHAPVTSGPPDTYQEFVRWAFATEKGMDLTKVAALWKDHRANLQAA